MNTLSPDRQAAVVRALIEGNSLRATARLTGVARNTVADLLRDVGAHCKNHHDRFVTGLAPKRVQMDEIWSFAARRRRTFRAMTRAPAQAMSERGSHSIPIPSSSSRTSPAVAIKQRASRSCRT
jgi:hypothetical protein